MKKWAFSGSLVLVDHLNVPPRIQFLIVTFLTLWKTSARDLSTPWSFVHAILIAFSMSCTAPYVGGPKEPSVMVGLAFFQPAMIDASEAMPLMSGAKFAT